MSLVSSSLCKQLLFFGYITNSFCFSNDGRFFYELCSGSHGCYTETIQENNSQFVNCLLFFYMFLISEVSVINFMPVKLYGKLLFEIVSVLYIPFLALCLYCTYQLCKLCVKHVQKRRNAVANQSQDDSDAAIDAEQAPLLVPVSNYAMGDCEYVADDLYADRILNPGGYNEQHVHYQPLENSTQ